MAKVNNPSQEEPEEDMQQTTVSSTDTQSTSEENRTRDKFAEFHKNLIEDELEQADANIEVAHNELREAEEVNEIKGNAWDDAAEFLTEYITIHREISLNLSQSTTEFEGNVLEAKTMRDTVKDNLGIAITGIKALSKNLLEVCSKANNLDKLLKDTCNQEEYRFLNKSVKLKPRLDKFMEEANQAAEAAGDNFSNAVIVNAIHAQLNLDSIGQLLEDVKSTVSAFETDINDNLNYGRERDKLTRDELDATIKKLVEANDNHDIAHLHKNSLITIRDFADPDSPRLINRPLEDIIEENEENFKPLPDVDEEPKKNKNTRRKSSRS